MVKKLRVWGLILLSIIVISYVWADLYVNAVYYASHCPHSGGSNPLLVEVSKHIEDLESPNYKQTGISYQLDGTPEILSDKYELAIEQAITGDTKVKGQKVIAIFSSPTFNQWFVFNNSGRIIAYYKGYSNGIQQGQISLKSRQKYLDELNKTLNNINTSQHTRPRINLQWLYNLLNYWRFHPRG